MDDVVIKAQGLTKYYGDFPAITDVSFSVGKGQIVGFLGPNGSGKTTTMRILAGYMPPTSGSVQIAGFDTQAQSLEARRRVGYLPETTPIYTDMSVSDCLSFLGRLHQVGGGRLSKRVDEVMEICGLGTYRNTLIAKLSKGYRQRVGLAQAILHEPDVLILDEPTIGIDPIQVSETRHLIREWGRDHSILLSTHILAEAQALCERVLIIHDGVLVAEDTPANLAQRLHITNRIQLQVRGPTEEVANALKAISGVHSVTHRQDDGDGNYTVESQGNSDIQALIARAVVGHGWGLLNLTVSSVDLEEIFLQLTTDDQA